MKARNALIGIAALVVIVIGAVILINEADEGPLEDAAEEIEDAADDIADEVEDTTDEPSG